MTHSHKKTILKVLKHLFIMLLVGAMSLHRDNPALLIFIPVIEYLLDVLKHKWNIGI